MRRASGRMHALSKAGAVRRTEAVASVAKRQPTGGDRPHERRCEICDRRVRIPPVAGGNGKLDMCSSCARRRPIDLRKIDEAPRSKRPRHRSAARQTAQLDEWTGAAGAAAA